MKLDLNEVASHLGKHISYQIDEPPIVDPEGGLTCVEPIKGSATFTNTGRHIVVRGSFSTEVELECARCLKNHIVGIELPIEEELPLPGGIPAVAEEQEDEELLEDEDDPLFEENMLDLTELLRQSILIAVPIKPVCSEECKGLCTHCGRDLNDGPCSCPPEVENSPFAGLASLLTEKERET